MKFELEVNYYNIPEEDLINDVIAVSKITGKQTVTARDYKQHGTYCITTLLRRFNSWAEVMRKAGLKTSRILMGVAAEELLFENLAEVWTKLGRQPRAHEMMRPLSKYQNSCYIYRYGSWRNALKEFVACKEREASGTAGTGDKTNLWKSDEKNEIKARKLTPRLPSYRLKFRVFSRDRYCCVVCGKSPATHPGLVLHCDHIRPWSRDGETTMDNLQTLCSECNLGKGDMEHPSLP